MDYKKEMNFLKIHKIQLKYKKKNNNNETQ